MGKRVKGKLFRCRKTTFVSRAASMSSFIIVYYRRVQWLMAEGARFELAVQLPGLRFSRPARSAAPSPLRRDKN